MNSISEPTNLGLDDDLDPIELLGQVEQVFGIKITDEEAAQLVTVGDLHGVIVPKLPSEIGSKCRTQMTFYRLRKALAPLAPDLKLSPSTPIDKITSQSPKKLLQHIEQVTGIKPPPTDQTFYGDASGVLILIFIVAAPISALAQFSHWVVWSILIFCLLLSIVLARIDPGKFFQRDVTLGGLASSMAIHNYGKLIDMGGRHNEKVTWDVLVNILALYSEAIDKDEITTDTVLLDPQLAAQNDTNTHKPIT